MMWFAERWEVVRSAPVDPRQMPSYLALTSGPAESTVTTGQARRLLEVDPNIAGIFNHLSSIPSAKLRKKLSVNRKVITC